MNIIHEDDLTSILMQPKNFDAIKYNTKILSSFSPKKRVELYHKQIDKLTKPAVENKKRFDCKKGCAHCCYIRTTASTHEVDVIVEYVKENNINVNLDTLRKQIQYGIDVDGFEKNSYNEKRCAFLDKGDSCKIYPVRPGRCRSYYVIKNSCDGNNNNKKVGSYFDINIEIAHTAMLATDIEGFGHEYSFAYYLYKKLKDQK